MPYITKSALKKIYDALDNSIFSASSFTIETPDREVFARIRYSDNQQYYFIFQERSSRMYVQYSPGDLRETVVEEANSLDSCISLINNWCTYIQRELRTGNLVYDALDKMKAEFSEKLNSHFGDTNVHFSKEEAQAMHSKFEELLVKFAELRKQNSITEDELRKVKETVTKLEEALSDVPKKTWFRSAASKFMDLGSKFLQSPQGQKLLANAGERLLTAGQHTTSQPPQS